MLLSSLLIASFRLRFPLALTLFCVCVYVQYLDAITRVWGDWALFQRLLTVLRRIGDRHGGASIANIAVRWVLDHPFVGAVLVGMSAFPPSQSHNIDILSFPSSLTFFLGFFASNKRQPREPAITRCDLIPRFYAHPPYRN